MSDCSTTPSPPNSASTPRKMKKPSVSLPVVPSQTPNPSSLSISSPSYNEESFKRGRKESEQRRRVLMNQYYDELVILLSMISERTIPKKLDKASTLHEAVRCLRTYAELTPPGKSPLPKHKGKGSKKGGSKAAKETESVSLHPRLLSSGDALQSFLDAHDTFLLIVSDSGHILYTTELITALLGHMQTRLVGQNLYDYILESDRLVLQKMFESGDNPSTILSPPNGKVLSYPVRSLDLHFKLYTGETGSLTQHLPFTCLSYLRRWKEVEEEVCSPPLSPLLDIGNVGSLGEADFSSLPSGGNNPRRQSCILLFGKLPTNLTLLDLPLGLNEVNFSFDMRVSKNCNIINIDVHSVLVLGYTIPEFVGSHFFDYVDPYHLLDVGERMADIFNNTRGSTNPYRFRSKGGRYIWLLSKGYLSYNPWNHKPDHILLSCRVLGCDHVVPELRFFRSRSLLPDVSIDNMYKPPPLGGNSIHQTAQHQQTSSATATAATPTTTTNWEQAVYDTSTSVYTPMVQFPSTPTPHQIGNGTQPTSSGYPQQTPQQHDGILQQQSSTAGQSSSSAQLNGREQENTSQQRSLASRDSSVSSPAIATTTVADQNNQQQTSLDGMQTNLLFDFKQEMEKKNNELFDLQRRLLEQQMLMEQERNQFYQVAQQVMQYIGTSPGSSSVTPNFRLPPPGMQSGEMLASSTTPSLATSQDKSSSGRPHPTPSGGTNLSTGTVFSQSNNNTATSSSSSSSSSDANFLSVFMQSRKSPGDLASPHSMFQSQSSVGALRQTPTPMVSTLANPLGQQPVWGGINSQPPQPMTAQQKPKNVPLQQHHHHQQQQQQHDKPSCSTATAPAEKGKNPYSMLLTQQSLRGVGNPSWASQLQPQTTQLPHETQNWNQQQQQQQRFSQQQFGTSGDNSSPYAMLSSLQASTNHLNSPVTVNQQQTWSSVRPPQSWPMQNHHPQQQQQQQVQQRQLEGEKGSPHQVDKSSTGASGESVTYSMLPGQPQHHLQSSGNNTRDRRGGGTSIMSWQGQTWSGSLLPAAATITTQHQQQQRDRTGQGKQQPSNPSSLQPSARSQPQQNVSQDATQSHSIPSVSTATNSPSSIPSPYHSLANQLKTWQTASTPSPVPSPANPSPSNHHHQLSQHQSESIRLPTDEEIQNLLDNIQMKCSSNTIPGLSSPSFQ